MINLALSVLSISTRSAALINQQNEFDNVQWNTIQMRWETIQDTWEAEL
jgi:hypothetical protein